MNSKAEQRKCHESESDEDLSSSFDALGNWTHRLLEEVNQNIFQFHDLCALKDRIDIILENIEIPLGISQENQNTLYVRRESEKPNDVVGKSLLFETETFEKRRELLLKQIDKIYSQLTLLRDIRHEMEVDIHKKNRVKETSECVKILATLSKEIGDVEMPDQTDLRKTSPSAWIQYTEEILEKSQTERNKAQKLSVDVSREMLLAANGCFGAWYATNAGMKTRISEIAGTKKELEHHLQKIEQNITTLRSNMEDVKNAIKVKKSLLQATQSQIDQRKQRPGIELCRDPEIMPLLREMQVLKNAAELLKAKSKEMGDTLKTLLQTKSTMARDIRNKNKAFADLEFCLAGRQARPISTFQVARSARPFSPSTY